MNIAEIWSLITLSSISIGIIIAAVVRSIIGTISTEKRKLITDVVEGLAKSVNAMLEEVKRHRDISKEGDKNG